MSAFFCRLKAAAKACSEKPEGQDLASAVGVVAVKKPAQHLPNIDPREETNWLMQKGGC
jgi:hypothetical protein